MEATHTHPHTQSEGNKHREKKKMKALTKKCELTKQYHEKVAKKQENLY